MTREELIAKYGSEDQANFVIAILLKNVKPAFIKSAINTELSEVEGKIAEYKTDGFIYTANGHEHVSWGKSEELKGWDNTEEEKKLYIEARKRCNEASDLLYRRNRLISLSIR